MIVYIGHSTNYDFLNDLYKPIRNDKILQNYNIILPHEQGYSNNHKRSFYSDIDLMICDASYNSTGLGIELGFAFDSDVPIYCIYKKDSKISSSLKFVTTNFYEYTSSESMIDIIRKIISEYKKTK